MNTRQSIDPTRREYDKKISFSDNRVLQSTSEKNRASDVQKNHEYALRKTLLSDYSIKNIHEEELVNREGHPMLVTPENFQEIIFKIANDTPAIISLKIGFILLPDELQQLHAAVQNNTELGYIGFHENQVTESEIVKQVETKLIDNNKNYSYHPNDYVHGLLSKHAYVNSAQGDPVTLESTIDEQLKNWVVAEVYNDTQTSGYYGAIYINHKTHQVVLASRGTEGGALGVLTDAFKQQSDWDTNLKETFIGEIVIGQQARNYQSTEKAIKIAKEKGYRLSFTGHSLGAWLAELCAFYSHAYFDYCNIKAVTFDSPGALPMMEKLQSNIKSKDTEVDLNDIEVITYLAVPNPVNCCNSHVGKVYRIEPQMAWSDWVSKTVPSLIMTGIGDKIKGVLSSEGHMLTGILAIFDPETGKPKEYTRMADWPRMKYTGNERDFSNQRTTKLKEGLESKGISSTRAWISAQTFDYLIGDATLMTMIDFLLNLTKADQEQYWTYFAHIDWEKVEDAEVEIDKIFNNRFALIAKAKYREYDNNFHKLNLNTGSVDKYIYKLYNLSLIHI